jgi:hypothetical protein
LKRHDWQYWALLAIALASLAEGLAQALWPAALLKVLSAEIDAASRLFFIALGLLGGMFAALLAHTLLSCTLPQGKNEPPVVLWFGLQKLAISAALGFGVVREVFAPATGLGVAGYELAAGLLALWYWSRRSGAQDQPTR